MKEHKNWISLDQTRFIKLLDTVNLKDENWCFHDTLQSTMGMWISCQTRTDISFDVCHVAPNLKNSTLAHIKHLNSHISSKRIKIFINVSVSWWNFKVKISCLCWCSTWKCSICWCSKWCQTRRLFNLFSWWR